MFPVYFVLTIFGILMFFSLLIFLSFFIYSLNSEKKKDAKEREYAPYHEAGHVVLAIVTGMGFEKVTVAGSSHNFGYMSHQKDQYSATRTGKPEILKKMDQRELLENALMTSLAGYVAEMLTCGKNSMPSHKIKYGDMEAIHEILHANTFLYSDLSLSFDEYLNNLTLRTRKILMDEADAHEAITKELIARSSLTEEEVWQMLTQRELCQHLHNPYYFDGFSLEVSS